MKNNHQDGALTNQATSDVKWEVSKHTKPDGATNAYGELEFTGAGQASRAKVRKTTSAIYNILNILYILITFEVITIGTTGPVMDFGLFILLSLPGCKRFFTGR